MTLRDPLGTLRGSSSERGPKKDEASGFSTRQAAGFLTRLPLRVPKDPLGEALRKESAVFREIPRILEHCQKIVDLGSFTFRENARISHSQQQIRRFREPVAALVECGRKSDDS